MLLPDKDYFSIGEVCGFAQVKPHVLRYWEKELLIRPIRRETGQRRYTKKDIEKVLQIKELLYAKRYSIIGAKKELLKKDRKSKQERKLHSEKDAPSIKLIKEVSKEIKEIMYLLK